MIKTVGNLKEMIRAGRGILPAEKVIQNGILVNVMTSEIYPADVAIYRDTIVAVGDVRAGSVKRVAAAVGEGSVVISKVWDFVNPG